MTARAKLNVHRMGGIVSIWKQNSGPRIELDVEDVGQLLGVLGFSDRSIREAMDWAADYRTRVEEARR